MSAQEQLSYQDRLDRLGRVYRAFFALVDDYTEDRRELTGACGEWNARQVMAHMSGWLTEAVQRYDAFERGDTSTVDYDDEHDNARFNQASVDERAGLNWEETVQDLRQSYERYLTRAGKVVDPEQDPRYANWQQGLWQDCVEHLGQLTRFHDPS